MAAMGRSSKTCSENYKQDAGVWNGQCRYRSHCANLIEQHTKRKRNRANSVPHWLCTLPQSTTPNFYYCIVSEGLAGGDGGHRNTAGESGIESDDPVFRRTEIAHAADVVSHRRSAGDECRIACAGGRQTRGSEHITTLASRSDARRGQGVVNEASLDRCRVAGSETAQVDQCRRRIPRSDKAVLYANSAVLMLRMALTAEASLAAIRARSRLGMAIAAMIRMIATTISSSIRENPLLGFTFPDLA